jgi:hypothetical protein
MNNLNLFDKNMNNFYDSVIVIFGFGRNYWIMVEQHKFYLSFVCHEATATPHVN